MNMTTRPLVQDLVKQAMEGASKRVQVAREGARQMKLASEKCGTCGESPCECKGEKKASAYGEQSIPTEYAFKLAAAIEYAEPELVELAKAAEIAPPPGVTASAVSGTMPGPGGQGKGHMQPPTNPGVQKAMPQEQSPTQLANTIHEQVPGTQTTAMSGGKGKTASAEDLLAQKNLNALAKLAGAKTTETKTASAPVSPVDFLLATVKEAEDAINPAHITAGAAVPPDTSAAGEAGGAPVGGMPQGPRGLVGSNESAINYKRNTAYSPRKAELAQYFKEPALSSATDTTLQQAFAHTGEAGVKLSSAGMVQAAAGSALLKKLAEQAKGA